MQRILVSSIFAVRISGGDRKNKIVAGMAEEVYYHQYGVWLTERWIHYGDTTRAVDSIVSIEMCVREPKDRALRVLLGIVLLGFLIVFTPSLGFLSLGVFSLWIRYMDSESPREYFVLLGFEGGHREYIPVPFAKASEVIDLKKAINRARHIYMTTEYYTECIFHRV